MEIFILLVLSVGLCQAGPVPDDVSCDDPEVFEAVSTAITRFNEEGKKRNVFALNVILHVHRIAGSEKSIRVIYQIRETACSFKYHPWQTCDLLETSEEEYGNCTAEIETDRYTVIQQDCKFASGQKYEEETFANCLGCWHPIDPTSLEVLPIVRFTIRQFNNRSEQSTLYEVREMKKASRQVVNGWNYQLEYLIKETNCSKNEFPDLTPACRPLPEGKEGLCTVTAYVDNANTLVRAEHNCQMKVDEKVEPPVLVCRGCPKTVPTDSPELDIPLPIAIEWFNAKNDSDFHFKIVEVIEATSQVLAGIKYRFKFVIQKTNCSKAEVEKLNENCTAVEDGERLYCRGSVYMRPWVRLQVPEVTCSETQISQDYLRVPPGFTPFRSALPVANDPEGPRVVEEFHIDPRGRRTHEKKQGHGHRHRHRHGHRHKHKKSKESSSEEVAVLPAIETPSQLPTSKAFLEQEANSRSPHGEPVGFPDASPVHSSSTDSPVFLHHLPDLPEPPKCPGTPWKPERAESEDTLFNDFDLYDALQD